MFKIFDSSKGIDSVLEFVDRYVADYYVSVDFREEDGEIHVFIGQNRKPDKEPEEIK